MELLPQPVGSASEFDFQLVFKPGKLSQPKQIGAIDVYPLIALPVCSQRAGQNKRISGIVLCAGDGETVTKPVYLFRIDREQSEATLDKSFNERAPGHLDADSDQRWLACGSLFELVDQGDEAVAAMGCVILLYSSPVTIQDGDAVGLRSPVNPDKVLKRFIHDLPPRIAL
jgi:hypothetical protein